MNFEQEPVTGDLVLLHGELQTVSEQDATLQRVRSALRFFKGEWFMDKTQGIDWFGQIFVKDPVHAEAILKRAIAETKGVNKLVSFTMTVGNDRKAVVNFSFLTDAGVEQEGTLTQGG